MTAALFALLVALASTPTAQAAGSEVGVLDYAGHETVLLCNAGPVYDGGGDCVGYALIADIIVVLPE